MPNNLYQQLNQNQPDNFQKLINDFNTFKNSFQGDPHQIVQELLQSGRMSQAQYNQLSQMAMYLKNFLY